MPPPRDPDDPTPEELDLLVEHTTGKPVDKGSTVANIAALQKRIALLEDQARKISGHADTGKISAASAAEALRSLNADLASARDQLAGYEAQFKSRN